MWRSSITTWCFLLWRAEVCISSRLKQYFFVKEVCFFGRFWSDFDQNRPKKHTSLTNNYCLKRDYICTLGQQSRKHQVVIELRHIYCYSSGQSEISRTITLLGKERYILWLNKCKATSFHMTVIESDHIRRFQKATRIQNFTYGYCITSNIHNTIVCKRPLSVLWMFEIWFVYVFIHVFFCVVLCCVVVVGWFLVCFCWGVRGCSR